MIFQLSTGNALKFDVDGKGLIVTQLVILKPVNLFFGLITNDVTKIFPRFSNEKYKRAP